MVDKNSYYCRLIYIADRFWGWLQAGEPVGATREPTRNARFGIGGEIGRLGLSD